MASFLDRIVQIFRPIRRTDSVFGNMVFQNSKQPYWEGKAFFQPENVEIEVFVDGDRNAGLEMQHAFFEEVGRNWAQLKVRLQPELNNCYSDVMESSEQPFGWEKLKLRSISVPMGTLSDAEWAISFHAKSGNGSFWIELKRSDVVAVTWDC